MLGLTSLTHTGLTLGIGVGLFFGEGATLLQPLGDGFVMLLQIAVLPYFVVLAVRGQVLNLEALAPAIYSRFKT
jgi:Na+/H+-dicarboxylate symporter